MKTGDPTSNPFTHNKSWVLWVPPSSQGWLCSGEVSALCLGRGFGGTLRKLDVSLQLGAQGWCRLQPGKAKAAVSASQRHHRTKNFWVPFSSSPSRPTSEGAEADCRAGEGRCANSGKRRRGLWDGGNLPCGRQRPLEGAERSLTRG